MKKIGILGSGIVAKTLGAGLLKHGYAVKLGTRDVDKLAEWKTSEGKGAEIGTFKEAASFGEIVILAVTGSGATSALDLAGAASLKNKTVIDATNPIANAAPENGVLKFFTTLDKSLMEQLQHAFPAANFVKAFNCVGNAFMIDPKFESKPTMFICGNDENAKLEVAQLLEKVGWESADFGKVQSARAIEPLCILWCIPGFLNNNWMHAFKLLKL
ncbi:NAD(P)-binding domain-containing protein [Draconibacterium sp.]|jgi:predicted dinucleotide-binding enzyme